MTEETGRDSGNAGVSRVANALARLVVVVVVAAYAIFFAALAVGGDAAISDTWVGFLAGYALLGGLAVSSVAFVSAIVAVVRGAHAARLWLPLVVFPGLVSLVALAELFVLE